MNKNKNKEKFIHLFSYTNIIVGPQDRILFECRAGMFYKPTPVTKFSRGSTRKHKNY